MMGKSHKLKPIYNFKSFNLYEIDVDDSEYKLSPGSVISIEGLNYVVIKEIHRGSAGGHKLTDDWTDYYKLIVTDDKILLNDAYVKKIAREAKTEKFQKEKIEKFNHKLIKYLENKDSIYINVAYHQKDNFKNHFMGRVTWDMNKKLWKLRFQSKDFENLKYYDSYTFYNDAIEINNLNSLTFRFIESPPGTPIRF